MGKERVNWTCKRGECVLGIDFIGNYQPFQFHHSVSQLNALISINQEIKCISYLLEAVTLQ